MVILRIFSSNCEEPCQQTDYWASTIHDILQLYFESNVSAGVIAQGVGMGKVLRISDLGSCESYESC